MSGEALPHFRYHPDPVGTRSVVSSPSSCSCCGRARGFVYTGPAYATQKVSGELCPWCIADGSAADTLDAEFTDVGAGVPDDVPREVLLHVATRTPGFAAWQQERWLYHCGDAAAFLGRAGYGELHELDDALAMLRQENRRFGRSDDDVELYIRGLRVDGDATAYLFRCLHCGRHLAYSDAS